MNLDWLTKVALVVIATSLAVIAFRPKTPAANAQGALGQSHRWLMAATYDTYASSHAVLREGEKNPAACVSVFFFNQDTGEVLKYDTADRDLNGLPTLNVDRIGTFPFRVANMEALR